MDTSRSVGLWEAVTSAGYRSKDLANVVQRGGLSAIGCEQVVESLTPLYTAVAAGTTFRSAKAAELAESVRSVAKDYIEAAGEDGKKLNDAWVKYALAPEAWHSVLFPDEMASERSSAPGIGQTE